MIPGAPTQLSGLSHQLKRPSEDIESCSSGDDYEQGPYETAQPPPPRRRESIVVAVVTITTVLFVAIWFLLRPFAGTQSLPKPQPTPTIVPPIRIVITGDSISHGREGDYTWRYRLWEWLQEQEVQAEFLGPSIGTYGRIVKDDGEDGEDGNTLRDLGELPPEAGYALDVDPEFVRSGSAHYTHWGKAAWELVPQAQDLVETYQPDYLLVELGFNDMGWGVYDARDLLASMKQIVDRARAAKPNIKMAIANVPHRRTPGPRDTVYEQTQEYNGMLRSAIAQWTQPDSPIALVKFNEVYTCGLGGCQSGYDGLHPNALGEFEIAHAFTKVLREEFHIGKEPLAFPEGVPLRPCVAPENVRIRERQDGHRISWRRGYGDRGYELQWRTTGAAWPHDDDYTQVESNYRDVGPPAANTTSELRVRLFCDVGTRSPWSATVTQGALGARAASAETLPE